MKREKDNKIDRAEKGKRLGAVLNAICVLIVALVLYVVISYNTSSEIFGTAYYVDSTGSMAPAININDVVKTKKSVSLDSLNVGDTIAFYMDTDSDGEREIVFRNIAEKITDAEGKSTVLTVAGGDAEADSWYVTDKSYIGSVTGVNHKGGGFLTYLKNDNFMIAVIVVMVLLLAYEIGMYIINRTSYYKKLEEEGLDENGESLEGSEMLADEQADAVIAEQNEIAETEVTATTDLAEMAAENAAATAENTAETAVPHTQPKPHPQPVFDVGEAQYAGEINQQIISLYPKKRDNVRMFYGKLPYSKNSKEGSNN